MTRASLRISCALLVVLLVSPVGAHAQQPGAGATQTAPTASTAGLPDTVEQEAPDFNAQLLRLTDAAVRLPLAAGLSCLLALRPRRRGTPARRPSVIQTQIILSIIGAMVMLVVGSSLARAFGIVGAAGLVRYRAKVEDNKDAGVMLSTLAIGLAAGVGLWLLAIFGTLFIIGVLWAVESFEPKATRLFLLKVKTKDPAALKGRIEQLLRRYHATYEVRTVAQEELQFEVHWPFERHTDLASEAILALDASDDTEVEWEEKSSKK